MKAPFHAENVISCSQDMEAIDPGPSSVKLKGKVACESFFTIYLNLGYNNWDLIFLSFLGYI